jgi:phosphatidylglycerophosphatase A
MNSRDKAVMWLATGFHVGRVPFAPGTFGAILGLPLAWALAGVDPVLTLMVLAAFSAAAIWIAGRAEAILKRKDAASIVIDEIAGMAITLAGLPFTLFNAAAGFAAFRILDIVKPFPGRLIDTRMSGGSGVVLDDVVAGIYANLLLRLIAFFFNPA